MGDNEKGAGVKRAGFSYLIGGADFILIRSKFLDMPTANVEICVNIFCTGYKKMGKYEIRLLIRSSFFKIFTLQMLKSVRM